MHVYIDDIRNPPLGNWIVVRSSSEAINLMMDLCCPEFISFDHDLGGEDTAMIVVNWMIEKDLDNPGFIPANFDFIVHSANPIGKQNIQGKLSSYLKQR